MHTYAHEPCIDCFLIIFMLSLPIMPWYVMHTYAHEPCIDSEAFHRLSCAIVSLAARSFFCPPEKKVCKVKECNYTLEQI